MGNYFAAFLLPCAQGFTHHNIDFWDFNHAQKSITRSKMEFLKLRKITPLKWRHSHLISSIFALIYLYWKLRGYILKTKFAICAKKKDFFFENPKKTQLDNRGPDNRGPDSRGPDSRGTDSRGTDSRGTDSRGTDSRGTDSRGTDSRGTDSRGTDSRGTDSRGTDSRGTDSRGTDSRGTDSRGTDSRGTDSRGTDSRGTDSRGSTVV